MYCNKCKREWDENKRWLIVRGLTLKEFFNAMAYPEDRIYFEQYFDEKGWLS